MALFVRTIGLAQHPSCARITPLLREEQHRSPQAIIQPHQQGRITT
ncbi:hypothetical protein [Teichococcus aestuarii]